MIRAVIFDVDGVLLDSFESNFEFFSELMKAAKYQEPLLEQYRKLTHLSTRDVIIALTGLADEKEIDSIWQLSQELQYDAKKLPRLPDGAREVVAALNKQFPLGIVTNRTRKYLFESPLDSLQQFFSTSVAYEDVQHHKPHPEPLLLAAKKLGVGPGECVYVGDALTDVQAANAAGTKMIFYGSVLAPGADLQALSFDELPALIKKL